MRSDFTICSSYYSPESKALVVLNRELVAEKNPDVSLPWVVADNTPPDYKGEKLQNGVFTILPGARELEPEHIFGHHKGSAPSCEHGTVLNSFHTYVKTRFALILDNDFFITQPHWIERVLRHMDEHNITFFGSPFHPRYYHKLRYFPCPQLFFIDTEKVPMRTLDFMPECDFGRDAKGALGTGGKSRKHAASFSSLLRKFGRAVLGAPDKYNYHYNPLSIRERGMIEGSKDTVTHILDAYRNHPLISSECLQPTFKPWQDGGPGGLLHTANKAFEFFLPDHLCFVPKRKGYFTTRSFKDRGYYDVQGIDRWWEELVWQNEPFGFHLRQHRSVASRRLDADITFVRAILNSFSAKV